MGKLNSVELCAGAGGQALGLEQAGFAHQQLVEIDAHACATLRWNRPKWHVTQGDVSDVSGRAFLGIDLLAAGIPCPPFSVAGKQLGKEDERDLFPEILRLVDEARPRALFVENVPGLLTKKFDGYREEILERLADLGYEADWQLLNAKDFGVPQLRPRALLVAMPAADLRNFTWPRAMGQQVTVGEALEDEMGAGGWRGAAAWARQADRVGPTLVGGSKKHGGPDLGPTRARQSWAELGIDGRTIAEEAPARGFKGEPRLTVKMAAIVQGFPTEWEFVGKKTPAYRQVGNAFPPPVARAVGRAIKKALNAAGRTSGKAA